MTIRRASHCGCDTRYYLVWAPKYRKWVLQGAVRESVQELFLEIAAHHGFEMKELEVEKDDVHVFLSFPTKYSTGQVVGLLKAVSARGRFGRGPLLVYSTLDELCRGGRGGGRGEQALWINSARE